MRPQEIESSQVLRGIGVVLSLYFFFTFFSWNVDTAFGRAAARFATALPMAGMQSLSDWVQSLPSPWIRVLFQALGLVSLVAAASLGQPGKAATGLKLLAVLGGFKLGAYALDLRSMAPHHHVHLMFTALYLIGGNRLLWLRLALGAVCWMEALVRLSPSWLGGSYAYSLPSGLPLVPHQLWAVRFACWAILLLLLLVPAGLASGSPRARRWAAGSLLGYQLYAGLLLGLSYSALMVPLSLLLLGQGLEPARPLKEGRLLLLGGAILASGWSLIIPGDVRYSAEGRYLSLSGSEVGYRSRVVLKVGKGRHHWEIRMEWNRPDTSQAQACQVQILRNGKAAPTGPQSMRGRVFYNPQYFLSLPARLQNDPYVYLHWANRVQWLARPDELSVDLWTRLDSQEDEVQTLHLPDLARRTPAYNSLWRNAWISLPGEDASGQR